MKLLLILYVLIVIDSIASQDEKCSVPFNTTLDECLEGFANKWDQIRKEKPQVDALVFPTLAMTIDDMKILCSKIDESKEQCGNSTVTCDNHEISKFIQRNFLYPCRDQFFLERAPCLLSTIASQQQCLTLLKRKREQADPCVQIQEFFKCIHQEVYTDCQAKGLAALVHSIDRFGCDIKSLDASVGNPKSTVSCEPLDWQAVATCFQPLLTIWSNIRDNDTSFLNTAFPLFKFERSDLVRMCDLVHVIRDRCFVQIQKCPDHQLPEFVNAILGSACGTQQSSFFLSHNCIRSVIDENEQCHPYTVGAWQPGHLKEVCGRMPQYYKCLEKPVTAKCTQEATDVLAQAIRQYGCELNTDNNENTQLVIPTSPIQTTTTIIAPQPTATSQSITDGVLDFAASPPSHTAQPPAPLGAPGSIQQQPNNLQPFLQESRIQQQSFFLAPLIPPPSLAAPGPVDTFFGSGFTNAQLSPVQPNNGIAQLSAIQPAPPAAVLAESPPVPPSTTSPPVPTPKPFLFLTNLNASNTISSTPANTLSSSSIHITTYSNPTSTLSTSTPSSTQSTTQSTHPTEKSTVPEHQKGVVVPIPNVPKLLELCTVDKQNQLRDCLNPLYKRWIDIHGRMLISSQGGNFSFPTYYYEKNELVELCDHYASAFLRCPFSLFQECLTDDVVYLANAIFGYVCSPQNVGDFSRHFDCVSNVVRQRRQCSNGIQGALVMISHQSQTRCSGAREFYVCNKYQIEQSCTPAAEKVFRESVRQSGCDV